MSLNHSEEPAEDNSSDNSADWVRRELIRLLVDNVRDYAIFIMDLDGQILSWNEGAERILLHSEAEILGETGDIIFVPEDREAGIPQRERNTAFATGRSEDRRWHQRKDGSRFWADGVMTLIKDHDGSPRAFGKVMRDSTDRKRADEEIRRLLLETQAWAKREALLNRIGQEMRNSLDSGDVQGVAVKSLGEALSVDRCWFTLYNVPGRTLEIGQDWRSEAAPSLVGVYPFTGFGPDPLTIFNSGVAIIIDDVTNAELSTSAIDLLKTLPARSGICVPLHDAGTLVASLSVAMVDTPRNWSGDEVTLVEAVATQIRSALETTRLRMRERAIMSQFQEALTPSLPASIPGLALASFFQPAIREANVGGDFFDVYHISEERVVLVVGDVSGKGLEAAVQVAMVRNTLRYALYREQTLADAVTELNQTIATYRLLSNFVTIFVSIYDTRDRTLRYVSCGHEPTLIYQRKNAQVIQLLPTGPIMGVVADAQYHELNVELEPGDCMVAFTDGLSDAGPNRRELIGIEGLSEILERCVGANDPQELVNSIMAEAERFCRGTFHDDICLLAAIVQIDV